jgi:hypothetical protein
MNYTRIYTRIFTLSALVPNQEPRCRANFLTLFDIVCYWPMNEQHRNAAMGTRKLNSVAEE